MSNELPETFTTSVVVSDALHAVDWPADWPKMRVRCGVNRKNVALEVTEHIELVVHVPPRVDPDKVVYKVRKHQAWVYRQMRLLRPYKPDHPVKQLVGGEGFRLFGRPHRLRIVDDGLPIRCDDTTKLASWSGNRIQEIHLRRDQDVRAITDWYSRRGRELLTPDTGYRHTLGYWVNRIRLPEPPKLTIAHLKPREWGKINLRSNNLTLNWALFQFDYPLIDYVVARELAKAAAALAVDDKTRNDLRKPKPSKIAAMRTREAAYKLSMAMPDHHDVARQLRKDGATAWIGDVEEKP